MSFVYSVKIFFIDDNIAKEGNVKIINDNNY